MAVTNLRASTLQKALELVALCESFGVSIKLSDVIDAAVADYAKRLLPENIVKAVAQAAPTECPKEKCIRYYRMSGCVGCTRYPYPEDKFAPAKE